MLHVLMEPLFFRMKGREGRLGGLVYDVVVTPFVLRFSSIVVVVHAFFEKFGRSHIAFHAVDDVLGIQC